MSQSDGRGPRPKDSPVGLSGWLYADLLLALTIIALGAFAVTAPNTAGTPRSVQTPAAATTAPTPQAGVERTPTKLTLTFDGAALLRSDPGEERRVRRQLRTKLKSLTGRRAGIVLTFGHHPDINRGQSIAGHINALLRTTYPQVFAGAATKDLANVSGQNRADLEIYLFTSDPSHR